MKGFKIHIDQTVKASILYTVLAIFCFSCSTQKTWKGILEPKMKRALLQDQGRNIIQTKTVLLDDDIKREYQIRFPGEKLKTHPSKQNYWVGVSTLGREPLSQKDYRFLSDTQPCETLFEISDATQIEMQIPFAFPFYRVFHVQCDKPGSLNLESPLGALSVWSGP
jgi:hypothetical protein